MSLATETTKETVDWQPIFKEELGLAAPERWDIVDSNEMGDDGVVVASAGSFHRHLAPDR